MSQYPEIQALEEIIHQYKISIEILPSGPFTATEHEWVSFRLKGQSFMLIVDDEVKDFQNPNKALHLCLVLRELETYQEEEDFLKWTNLKGLPAGDSTILQYYRDLSLVYAQISKLLGKIDSKISYFDFEFNAGAAQALRKSSKTS